MLQFGALLTESLGCVHLIDVFSIGHERLSRYIRITIRHALGKILIQLRQFLLGLSKFIGDCLLEILVLQHFVLQCVLFGTNLALGGASSGVILHFLKDRLLCTDEVIADLAFRRGLVTSKRTIHRVA